MIAITPAVIRTTLESGSKAGQGSEQQQKKPTTALLWRALEDSWLSIASEYANK